MKNFGRRFALLIVFTFVFVGCVSTSEATQETIPPALKSNLPNILFAPDSIDLLAGEQERIKMLAEILRTAPGSRFIIVGHTADLGRPQGQQELSLARAERIAQLLAAEGILPEAMRHEGRGGTEPISNNATAEGRAMNRRVEVHILP